MKFFIEDVKSVYNDDAIHIFVNCKIINSIDQITICI